MDIQKAKKAVDTDIESLKSEDESASRKDTKPKKSKNNNLLKLFIGFSLIFLITLIVWMAYSLFTAKPCSNEKGKLYNEISKNFSLENKDAMNSLAKKIKSRFNYNNDPNCLATLIGYDYTISNYDEAQNRLNKLEKFKQGSYTLNPGYTTSAIYALNDIQAIVEFMKLQKESIKNSTFLIKPLK